MRAGTPPLAATRLLVLIVAALLPAAARAQGCQWSLSADYIANANPNPGGTGVCSAPGVWSFEQQAAGAPVLLPTWQVSYAGQTNLNAWMGSESIAATEFVPTFAKNFGSVNITWAGNKYIPTFHTNDHLDQ